MKYTWQGINNSGEVENGWLIAANKKSAQHSLAKQNIGITKLSLCLEFSIGKKIKSKDIQNFLEQLASLFNAHLTLEQALVITKKNLSEAMRALVSKIEADIQSGLSFSAALEKHPKYFKSIDCKILAAGEQSGALAELTDQLAHFKKRLLEIKQKICKALFYPVSILLSSLLISFGMLRFVVPQFESMFASFNSTLPLYTRTIIAASDWLIAHQGLLLLLIGSVLASLMYLIKKQPKVRRWLFIGLYHCPLIKQYLIQAMSIRFCRVLTTLLSAGLASFEALQLANQSICNPYTAWHLQRLEQQVATGSSLAQALRQTNIFPSQLLSFIQVGEASGQLAALTTQVADYYQQQLDQSLDQLSKLLEPMIMLIVATLVGGLIIALYLPIFQMGAVV